MFQLDDSYYQKLIKSANLLLFEPFWRFLHHFRRYGASHPAYKAYISIDFSLTHSPNYIL